jgi:acetyl esterase/lipase
MVHKKMKPNMNIKKTKFILAGMLVLCGTLKAQEEIKLYPKGAAETSGIVEKEENFDNTWVVNVTEARMYAYIAPKEKATGTAVLICPGGGYGGLAVEHEGSQFAAWLNTIGISAFVLYYRMPNQHCEIPLKDAQTALRIIRKGSKKWNLDKHKIGIAGFSAGGHLASTVGTHFTTETRPDFMLLVYPVISMTGDGTCQNLIGKAPSEQLNERFSNELQVTAQTPPTFIVAAMDDDVVPVEHSIMFYKALQAKNVASEIRTFDAGGHGFGMRKRGLEVDIWPELFEEWLKSNKLY